MSTKIWEATETDLVGIVKGGQEESTLLDYKDSRSLTNTDAAKTELSKDVSAFANSEGGAIIYGVSETRISKQPPKPVEIDQGVDPAEISKEWIESVINSRIQRRISGVKIHQIALDCTRPGRVAYVVWVPQSYDAPHQAYDKRYYKRFNFQSVPMEDWEVRDVRNRHSMPVVGLYMTMRARQPKHSFDTNGRAEATLSILLRNDGNRIAQQVYLEVDLPLSNIRPAVWKFEGPTFRSTPEGIDYRQLRYHHRDAAGPLPLFPHTDFEVLDGNHRYVHLQFSKDEAELQVERLISWRVYADDAQPRTGEVSIKELFQLM